MTRILAATAIILALAACGRQAVKPDPVPEQCGAQCRVPCDTAVPQWVPTNPDAPAAWDSYPRQVTIPMKAKLQTCELHRVACVQCLDRLKAAGVTK